MIIINELTNKKIWMEEKSGSNKQFNTIWNYGHCQETKCSNNKSLIQPKSSPMFKNEGVCRFTDFLTETLPNVSVFSNRGTNLKQSLQ